MNVNCCFLFQHVPPELFTPCLIDLCKALWENMKSYYKCMAWHAKHDKAFEKEGVYVYIILQRDLKSPMSCGLTLL